MFDTLSRGFRNARLKLQGKTELSEESVADALRDVRVVDVPICFTERREGESKMSGSVIAEAVVRPWVLLLHRGLRRLGIGRRTLYDKLARHGIALKPGWQTGEER